MRIFQASCLASAAGGAIGGGISSYSYGVVWILGGFLMGGFGGVLSFLLIIGLCSWLASVTGAASDVEGKNNAQHAVAGVTLGLTVLAPFLSIAVAMGLMALLRNMFN